MTPPAFELSSGSGEWIPAVIPGGVHESLIAAGGLSHPYLDEDETGVRWIEDQIWTYRTSLTERPAGHGERLVLVLPSVDGRADVYLDGSHIACHDNSFRPLEIDITDRELVGTELRVEVLWARHRVQGTEDLAPPSPTDYGVGPGARRPEFSRGWDFSPRVPSIGILQSPYIRRDRLATAQWSVRTVHVDAEQSLATVAVDVEVDTFGVASELTAVVTLRSPQGHTTQTVLPLPPGVADLRRGSAVVHIHDAQLWWTHDLGSPTLYDATLQVRDRDEVVVVADSIRVGLRTVTLDRDPDSDQPGRHFRFRLNGVPTYSRGANWVPPATLRGSVDAAKVRALVETARRGEMTMLRVWGGGAYEQDAFYEACDELGILVWQDFMFACVEYASHDPGLQAEAAREAEFQVRRLRNHPCLAVWCGNNEVHGIRFLKGGALTPDGDRGWGWELFHSVLPDAIARLSPGAVYWPGSPWSDSDSWGINGVEDGDRHAWEVWHGLFLGVGEPREFASRGEQVHWHRFCEDSGRFISEFGIHASPEQATLERWTPARSLHLRSPAFDGRNKDTPKDKGWALMEVETGLPGSLAEYVDYSMACQAEGLKFGVEHYRRRQPHNNGTLVWQFNDSWPGLSWSVVDYDLVPKHGFYALQRAFRPVIASFRIRDDQLELWVTNSGRNSVQVTVVPEVQTFAGDTIVSDRVHFEAPPYSSAAVWRSGVERTKDRFAWVSGDVEPNRLFFTPLKDLPLRGDLTVRVQGSSLELTASGFCYAARALSPHPGVSFDQNYLDIRDGETRTITLSGLAESFDVTSLVVRSYLGRAARVCN